MGAAPRVGDDAVSSRPYAGNSEYPTVLIHVTTIFWICTWVVTIRSVRTISRKGSGLTMVEAIDRPENPQRPNADHLTSYIGSRHEMKLWSDPYGDVGRPAETSGPLASHDLWLVSCNSDKRNSLSGKFRPARMA